MSKLVWDIVGDYESCHMPHILIEERKHEDAVESIFACLDCLEEGIRKATEERIIKLLEEQIEVHEYYAAIELIKGENK